MPKSDVQIYDGCTAAAHVAYANSDTAFIFPITPSSAMAESADLWAHQERKNIFNQVTGIRQMQSEAGAAGAVHGSLVVGCLTTTFTASQGLLLMLPNMYKIAGELTACVFHVSARAVATQALSIFGDHSDVMAVRQCGWAILSSSTVQEAMDLAQISHMATLKARVPFIHFFDGFRTSHELQKIHVLDNDTMRSLVDHQKIQEFRDRGLNPTNPTLIGTAQGPEIYFQNVEATNKYYDCVPSIVEEEMERFFKVVGRRYEFYNYYGDPEATDIIVIMGAGSPVCMEVIDYYLEQNKSMSDPATHTKVGVITVHLFRPWHLKSFIAKLPETTKRIAVMDRTKESGALGEPLYLDVAASLQLSQRSDIKVYGGRYGLGSKDFTSSMVIAIYENMRSSSPKPKFTVGIEDDVTNLSLPFRSYRSIDTVPKGTTQCQFWGFGSDGTVSANKNVIKIIGDNTPMYVQGYFAYSAHKAGGVTVSHLRFGDKPITSQYLIQQADYVACHREAYVQTFDMVSYLKPKGVFVLNCPWTHEMLEYYLPASMRQALARKEAQLYTIDANHVAQQAKMGRRINNILMTVFFKLSGILPFEEAIALFKSVIAKTYSKKGQHVVEANWKCVDAALNLCRQVNYDREKWLNATDESMTKSDAIKTVPKRHLDKAPEFVNSVLLPLEKLDGDTLPTSTFQSYVGGRLPMGSAAYEKRGIAISVPIVDMELCTQCNYCSFVCPHAAIRPFLVDDDDAEEAPANFIMKKAKGAAEIAPYKYRIQVSPLDCTGCELCSIACPAKCLTMTSLPEVRDREVEHWNYAIQLKNREDLCVDQRTSIKGSQFYQPLMEFSGACEGCGETPYVKLLTQLFGERMIIANATGCSSIWGASYPSNPYTKNQKGYGPAWGNSLFEDNAEYGYGMIIACHHRRTRLHDVMNQFLKSLDADPKQQTIDCKSCSREDLDPKLVEGMQQFVDNWLTDANLCQNLHENLTPLLESHKHIHPSIEFMYRERAMFPKVSHWIIGGDGWAYDIGYGGLDHVIASGVNVNILVLDTEVYSNTGGQTSKSTPIGAVHKFSAGGNMKNKKDLGMICMQYGNVYVASVASSANFSQTVRTFVEAEQYNGPSVILAYAPCIEHGYIKPFSAQVAHCSMAVDSGYWPLYRHNPALISQGLPPLQLDSKKLKIDVRELLNRENRFAQLQRTNPELAKFLEDDVCLWVKKRFNMLKEKAESFGGSNQNVDKVGADSGSSEPTVNVLYGSETGNAEEVATRIAAQIRQRGWKAQLSQLSEIELDELAEMEQIIIVCSTAGQGEFPGNAKQFYEDLHTKFSSDTKSMATFLEKVNYAVFGLGDSSYIFFNEAAIKLDKLFSDLGAKRHITCGLGDDQHEEKFDTALMEWLPLYWKEAQLPELQESDEPAPSLFKVTNVDTTNSATLKQLQVRRSVPAGSTLIRLLTKRRMTPEDYDVEVLHLEFDLTNTNMRYSLGDSLAIWPETDEETVRAFCQYFNFDLKQWIHIQRAGDASSAKHEALFKHPMTIKQLLTECLDLTAKPNRRFYEILYKYCADAKEKDEAKNLLEKKSLMASYQKEEYVNCFDMIKKFKSITKDTLTLDRLIDLIPLHKPRYYSIASSQKFVGLNRLDLCIGIVDWTTSKKELRYGNCTGYIRRLLPHSDENCSIMIAAAIKPTAFNLPPNDSHPIIMAGMGTGLAPFRSFIQHRAYLKQSGKTVGPVVLYFGCRYSKKDYLYGEELEDYQKKGVITDLNVAFSRDQKEKFYVQHHIDKDPALLYKRLITEKGYFYLCGSAKQVPIDVRAAIVRAISKEHPTTIEEADKMVTDMQVKGQYNVEAW